MIERHAAHVDLGQIAGDTLVALIDAVYSGRLEACPCALWHALSQINMICHASWHFGDLVTLFRGSGYPGDRRPAPVRRHPTRSSATGRHVPRIPPLVTQPRDGRRCALYSSQPQRSFSCRPALTPDAAPIPPAARRFASLRIRGSTLDSSPPFPPPSAHPVPPLPPGDLGPTTTAINKAALSSQCFSVHPQAPRFWRSRWAMGSSYPRRSSSSLRASRRWTRRPLPACPPTSSGRSCGRTRSTSAPRRRLWIFS